MDDIISHINALLKDIFIKEYPIKGINRLLPCDCSNDVKNVLPSLLNELKKLLEAKVLDSFKFGYFICEKFLM